MNMTTNINQARFSPTSSTVDIEENPERLQEAIIAATHVVDEKETHVEDGYVVTEKLTCACTWGDEELVARILRSCYVSEVMALPALAEAVCRGDVSIVRLLLQAGVSAWKKNINIDKSAFHMACEVGSEEMCNLLLDSMPGHKDIMYMKNGKGRNGLEILRDSDMMGIARRVEERMELKLQSTT